MGKSAHPVSLHAERCARVAMHLPPSLGCHCRLPLPPHSRALPRHAPQLPLGMCLHELLVKGRKRAERLLHLGGGLRQEGGAEVEGAGLLLEAGELQQL